MGRPKEFCTQTALEKALAVFWRYGFEGASMAELTSSMGITKPSLYASYGNKEELFRKALDLYDRKYLGFMREALEEPTSFEVVSAILFGVVRTSTNDEHPLGCMSTNNALVCSAAAEGIRTEVLARRKQFEAALERRLAEAQAEGDLQADADTADLVRFVTTLSAGLCLQASNGVSRSSLARAAEIALRSWPSPKPAESREALDLMRRARYCTDR